MTVTVSSKARSTTTAAFIQRDDGAVLLARAGDDWSLPVVETQGHWHAETSPVNAAIEERFGVRATTLRVLTRAYDEAASHGEMLIAMEPRGDAEERDVVRWAAIDEALATARPDHRDGITAWLAGSDDDPAARGRRRAWYRRGWLDETLGWCEARLSERGVTLAGEPEQSKHWSIASIWRLPTDRGDVWLKAVPDFFAHEGTLLQLIAPSMPAHLPSMIATDRERGLLLMEPMPQRTLWGAHDGASNDRAARLLAQVQQQWADRIDELLAAGCVDRRLHTLDGALEAVVARPQVRERFTGDEVERLEAFGATVPARVEELRACGVPETLMHGDFHPGNVAVDGDQQLVIFDWTDGCVSHPFFDLATYNPNDHVEHAAVTEAFVDAWSSVVDRAAVARASELAQPLACIHHATSYMRLLDNIHRGDQWEFDNDVLFWLHWLRAIIDE